jgi:GntR family transcriptional regulator
MADTEQPSPLNRSDATPLYLQLRQAILDELARSQPAHGERLPTERELQERYGVSRATVRSALDLLERQGYVVRAQGVGTLVARTKIEPDISQLTSFTEDLQAKGLEPSSATLEIALVSPPAGASEAFGLGDLDKVWYLRRLRFGNGEPIGIHDLYLPPTLEFSPRALQSMSSYYELLRERHGIEPMRALETFTAKTADAREASLLNVDEGAALLAIQRVTFDADERAIEYVDLLYRADHYEYRVELRRRR